MEFETNAVIHRPLEDVFGFFRDIDEHAGREGSVVTVYDKVTPGPVGVGPRYREVVRLLPFLLKGEVPTEVTGYDPPRRLDYRFIVFGRMDGELTYRSEPVGEAVRVLQRQTLRPRGALKPFSPLIRVAFSQAMVHRLKGIKELLEAGDSP